MAISMACRLIASITFFLCRGSVDWERVGLLDLAEFFDVLLELLAAGDGAILDACAVIVDGVDAVMQEFGNLRRVLNAQSDECEDADFGGEPVLFFGAYLRLGLE